MHLLPLDQNPLAKDTFERYKVWWSTHKSLFIDQKIGKDNTPLIQRLFAKNSSKWQNSDCPLDAIPYIEISPLYRKAKDGILFVNCNPSGTDYEYYREHNTNHADCFYYGEQKPNNSYFNSAGTFATAVGIKNDNYAMIDIFPIVIQNQAVLKEAYKNAQGEQRKAFNELLDYFLDNISQIQPSVIVATNAFVKDLFTSDDQKAHPFSLRNLSRLDDFEKKDDLVYYRIVIKGIETNLFCGGMIAGGHQMDTESKSRLIRDVKCFRNHSTIQF